MEIYDLRQFAVTSGVVNLVKMETHDDSPLCEVFYSYMGQERPTPLIFDLYKGSFLHATLPAELQVEKYFRLLRDVGKNLREYIFKKSGTVCPVLDPRQEKLERLPVLMNKYHLLKGELFDLEIEIKMLVNSLTKH